MRRTWRDLKQVYQSDIGTDHTERKQNRSVRTVDDPDHVKERTGTLSSRRMLSAETMTKVLRAAAKQTGEDPERFSIHSLRTGGASALRAAGVDMDSIRVHGRWPSDEYQAFIEEAPAATLQLAKRMGQSSQKPNSLGLPLGAARAQALERPSR
ncbi:hypothetical protein GN244_ATG16910 [Phytophthora infestans]|uniref:Tyr recombinase domain-containing protein n=1 Tax=Phytophthora infestans TaxID=4787 RepID=A0A833WLT5_PHYIN|nr:hypothetical protein GN244_ATG16910 [Phytophthora infestans]